MSTALLPREAAFAPRGFSMVQSGLYKVRVAWSAHLARIRDELHAAFALRRARVLEAVDRVRIALDPSISRRLAAYRVSEAHALPACSRVPVATAQAWAQPLELAVGFLDLPHRRVLAQHWVGQGQAAHAAIAAYTRLAGELMSLGAHPELLMHVHAAALERVHHAEGAFSIASAYAGIGISPAAWPELPRLARASGGSRIELLAALGEQALLEGWLSTAFGAATAQVAAVRATDGAVASHLRMVAEDSARQAEFGARLVGWALKLGGEPVALALALAIRKLPLALPEAAQAAGIRPEVLERNGLVPSSLRKTVYLSTRAQVVAEVGRLLEADEWERAGRARVRA